MASTNSLNTITVDGVTYNSAAYEASQTKDAKSNNLDKDAFLKLLVAQLKYQDPLEPEDNNEFISQMAQFSTLEQMNNMTDSMNNISTLVSNIDTSVLVGQLSGMIGKGVEWLHTTESADENGAPVSETTTLSGVVTGVTVASGTTKILAETADGTRYQVDVANIAHIYEVNKNTNSAVPSVENVDTLIGRQVEWTTTTPYVNESGAVVNGTEKLTGVVTQFDPNENQLLVQTEDSIYRVGIGEVSLVDDSATA